MTAEIAILNRSAVALAADSAVTLGIRGQQKIYNSVDKMFHLCLSEPVGVMIFGGAEFMGVPIETVIKKFRSSSYSAPKLTLREYATAFFDFLEKEIDVPQSLADENVEEILSEEVQKLQKKALDRYLKETTSKNGKKIDPKTYVENELENLVKARISSLKKQSDNSILVANADQAWCKARIDAVLGDSLASAQDKLAPLFLELASLLLQKDVYSNTAMGLVFAGFGTDEIFPRLQAFYSDGLINGRVKRQQFSYIEICQSGDGAGARIEAFAQKEMVERFLDGIDPTYETYLHSAIKEAMNDLGAEIVASFIKGSKKKRATILASISDSADKYLEQFTVKAEQRKETNYRQKILDMVNFMPKSDLANMAESLINLTSTKRRVSAESETVGGPIDVAVISKYDGFVWIKRKHYFDRELNPRYFVSQNMPATSTKGSA